MDGGGKYEALCTQARKEAQAEGALLIIVNGKHGPGFSVQAPLPVLLSLPERLENIARQIRGDMEAKFEPGVAQTYQAMGRAAGALTRDDVRSQIVNDLKTGRVDPGYFAFLRARLDELLKEVQQ